MFNIDNDLFSINIKLDNNNFEIGEYITGEFEFITKQDFDYLEHITINLAYHGDHVLEKKLNSILVYDKPIKKCVKLKKHFSLYIPKDCPISYIGNRITIEHFLKIGIKSSKDIGKLPIFGINITPCSKDITLKKSTDNEKLILSFKILGITALIILSIIIFWPIFFIVTPILLGYAIYYTMIFIKIGNFNIKIKKKRIKLGEKLGFTISFDSLKKFQLNSLKISLIGKEVYKKGLNRNSEESLFYEKNYILDENRLIDLENSVYKGYIDIPVFLNDKLNIYAPNSIKDVIDWKIKVYIDIPKWPDFEKSFNIDLLPFNTTNDSVKIENI